MKLKILLLVILLALIPQASATIFINQTSQPNTITLILNNMVGQNFTVPNYANASVYKLDYVEIVGSSSVGTQAIDMTISNYTYYSNNVTVVWDVVSQVRRYNFNDVYLLSNRSNYNFTLSSPYIGAVNVVLSDDLVGNPYSGGNLWLNNNPTVLADLTFNISLSPHDNVGNWTFNQGTGNYANDSSAFLNNGTVNGTTWSTNLNNGSVNGTALSFDGTYANVTANSTFGDVDFASTAFTISMWRYYKGSTGNANLITLSSATTTNYNAILNDGNDRLRLAFNKPAGGGDISVGATGLSVSQGWHYITATHNGGTPSTSNTLLYIDNVQISTVMGAPSFNPIIGNNVTIGSDEYPGSFFNGTIDEVLLYNYVINDSQRTAVYQQFQPVPAYPVGGLQINPTEATTYVNFSWHDTVYPQDEIIVATDSGFTNVVHDAFHSTDYANVSLTVGTTYYWKVKQFDSGTGSYGNTSAIQTFTLGTVPTFIRVNVFDELNLSSVPNINVTLISTVTNTSVNLTSTGSNNWVNFTNPSITDGVEYLAQVSALGYTTRNILISAPGNYSVYLPYTATSAGVSQINFVLSDYTGLFPYQSTKLIIQKVINTTLVNISSNYFDATGVGVVHLINGQEYQLVVESSLGIRSLGSYIPTASATSTLLVGTFSLQPSSAFNGLVYNFTYNSNQSIVLQWNDPNNEIVSLNETITNQLNAIVLQLITSVHSGQTTYLIANTSSKYLVQLNISTVHYGYLLYSLWYNPGLYSSSNASLAPTPAANNYIIPFGNTTNVSTTSNANAPIPQWVKNFFSVSMLVVMALLFNREHVLRGAVVVSLFSLIFWLTGMLVFDVGYITTGAILGMGFVIAIIALLAESNRG